LERRAQSREAARAMRAHVLKFRSEATEAETSRAGEMGGSVEFEGGTGMLSTGVGGEWWRWFVHKYQVNGWFLPGCGGLRLRAVPG
jgi:hypothetical protein